ncbi:DUF5682 family protein [Streptomyces sp. NPDC051776]|uniref:DUF5682 family protein n=1 Tax=Streptomyces sp. NPDC051776 TaxID=3155414 RepID=UPI00344AD40B
MLLGVRHHGPGSARAVRAALDRHRPRAVLIEGPPEADNITTLAGDPGMRPPVALLAHVADDPGRSVFWPLAEFSPEWVAMRWAVARGAPVRFIDLPAAHTLAMNGDDAGSGPDGTEPSGPEPTGEGEGAAARLRIDPLGVLAETAGYDDPERWWEDVVEHRVLPRAPATGAGRAGGGDRPLTFAWARGVAAPAADGIAARQDTVCEPSEGPDSPYAFRALAEAMGELRATYGDGGHERDAVREAHMRLRIRDARREFGDDLAVVCGAWHVPALSCRTTVTADRRLLKGLPRVKTEMTWVPWTHRRLAKHTGYGAGITSPGWYGHLFASPDRPVERWMTKVAGFLREEGRSVSSAHVIEAVRLAEALAAMRGRPLAGLGETTDAIRAVMCEGSDVPLALVRDRLVVGDALGEVPEAAPAVPLQRDLTRTQRSLRLEPEAAERELELDLRKDTDAGRSRLLHRLRILGIGWGEPARSRGALGTFRETWRLCWEPELSVRVAEAGVWGTTVSAAATAKAGAEATTAGSLADVTALAERCLLAGLSGALPFVMRVLADRAALDADVGHLAHALPALVRSVRYGDVRGTDGAALAEVATGLAERICVGLPAACAGLDADGAAEMRGHVDSVHTAVGLLAEAGGQSAGDGGGAGSPEPALRERWAAVLRGLSGRDGVAGVVRGRAARLLLDDGRLGEGEAARLMSHALSPGTPPADAAAWIEGFVGGGAGSGMLLVHDERLLGLVDAWLTGVTPDAFTDVLPLLRRTFAAYEPGVRRTLGELVRRGPALPGAAGAGHAGGPADGTIPGFGPGLDPGRADAVLPALRLLLGLDDDELAGVPG